MMITSGGQGSDEPMSEARAMADYLIGAGVPEGAILLEDKSTTTLENLTFSRRIMLARKPSISEAVEAIKLGAMDYFERPLDPQRLRHAIETQKALFKTQQELEA